VSVFVLVYVVYLYTLWPDIPLLVTLRTENAIEGHVARFLSTKGYSETGLGFLYWLPRILVDYFGVFVVVFFYQQWRGRPTDHAKLALVFGALVLMGLVNNEKYPAVKLFVLFALCFYNARFPRLTLRGLAVGGAFAIAGIVVVGGVYSLVSGAFRELGNLGSLDVIREVALDRGWALLAGRGMGGQTLPLYKIYELIPGQYDFFAGRTFANPRGILPYEPVALSYLIYESYNLPTVANLRGADPTAFFGEIYANFGLAVSWLSMFTFGVLIQVINSRLAVRIAAARTAFHVAFFYLLMAYVADLALGFTVPYFDERLWFFALFYILGTATTKRRDALVVDPVGSVAQLRIEEPTSR
jgi:hypothetical protein